MEKNTMLVGLLTLIIGLGGGYGLATIQTSPMSNHMMPNGVAMQNDDTSASMHDAMSDMMASLEGKIGDAFDQAFLQEMIVHHQGAVSMAQAALRNAGHPELKEMATAIIAAQTAEIKQMQDWQTAWYGR